ncbi:MAG: diacylglycerol kinase family protein [Bacilli bacterium]|nr:diacylglycerol kinase family protein [Bacilli bacterium]
MRYVLYNPLSTNRQSEAELLSELKKYGPIEQVQFVDVTKIEDGKKFMESLDINDDLVISGGDGTLNRLCNNLDLMHSKNRIYLHKAGNGNDFLRDVNELKEDFIEITDIVKKLPKVTINGESSYFVNGVGFGVDGMVCVESDKLKAAGKKVNYTSLAIKLLLFKYKKVNAKVTVDGKEYEFKRVFIGSVMNGKYYGGGMKEAPDQDRKSDVLSVVIWHDLHRFGALMLFPKIFEGKHVLKENKVTVLTGKEIKVEYSLPTDIQIDGESIHAISVFEASK